MQLMLTGEQKKVLALPLKNPILIRGVAGSGKTTIAIYRARHLIASDNNLFRATHVGIFSYTNSLVKYVQTILGPVETTAKISVMTFHKWAYDFLKSRGFWKTHSVAERGTIDTVINLALLPLRKISPPKAILQKPVEFYKEEFSWLKGRRIFEIQAYLDAKRTGRGTSDRVTIQDKEVLWELYASYRQGLQAKGCVDFDDFANLVLQHIEEDDSFVPPFSHVVIDEAQDLSAAQLIVLNRLVSPETNSITIIADAAQRIYKTGFAWVDVGINVRGARSVELKHNYRNTRQIADAAKSLLAHDPQQADFSEHIVPERDGPPPILCHVRTADQQHSKIIQHLSQVDLNIDSVVVLHRSRKGASKLAAFLKSEKFLPTDITSRSTQKILHVGLFTCTMSSIKGLEFDHVIICDLNDDVVPYPPGFTDENDELHISTERRLLYTCMTRARRHLLLISTGVASRYLCEIDPSKVETLGNVSTSI
jgi:superfamily I DNA/RNA helicase